MAEQPPKRQRIAAYALITHRREVLLTQMSARTRIQGRWTLPGGGIDHGEDPRDTVVREVHEETGLHVRAGRVLDVHSSHYVGSRSDGRVEDYHGIHVIFDAEIEDRSRGVTPRVVEQEGSTAEAAWVDLDRALSMDLLSGARHALENLAREV